MKRKLSTLLAAASFALAGYSQQIPINTNPPPAGFGDFSSTVLGYFTAFNTNLASTFQDNRFDIWTGASSLQGGPVSLVNDLGGSYDLWRPTPGTNVATRTALSFEADFRNGGVAGTLVSLQGGLGFSLLLYDVKVTVYGDGGSYTAVAPAKWSKDDLYGEVGIRVKKAIGTHFYTGVGMGAQFPKNSQVFSAFLGATF